MLCFALSVAVTATGLAQSGAGAPKHISGVYHIYSGEKRIQTDSYEVNGTERAVDVLKTPDDQSEQRIETALTMKGPDVIPYQKTLNGAPTMHASLDKDYIWFYEGEAKVGALTIDPYLMFFDPAAYAAYTILARSYNAAKGGSQKFPVIVPALQDYSEVEIERHGSDAFSINAKSLTAAHYRMIVGKRETVNLWVDADRVIAIQLSVKGLTIVDAAYPDLLKEVRRVMSRSL
jgi:hypothetical protein